MGRWWYFSMGCYVAWWFVLKDVCVHRVTLTQCARVSCLLITVVKTGGGCRGGEGDVPRWGGPPQRPSDIVLGLRLHLVSVLRL